MPKKVTLPAHYVELRKLHRDAATLQSVDAMLGWDQETYMPPAAAAHRADQQAMINEMAHQKRTASRIGELLTRCELDKSLTKDEATSANLREMRRDYDRATRLPSDLVGEIARTQSLAQEAWKKAREANDFKQFRPWLEKMIGLMRKKAECYGTPPSGELYDNLLDEYEPGMTAAQIDVIFTALRPRLSALVQELAKSKAKVSTRVTELKLPVEPQKHFATEILNAMGFDMEAGRLDVTTHPFCSSPGPADTRLTTRYGSPSFLEPLSSTMHEAGHGLYEQGLPKAAHFGEPLGDAISLGIHESQSRMWENFVGRSRSFWQWGTPVAKKALGPSLKATPEQIFQAANVVRPSFIRVEADEATYNLHVMLRFNIERALIGGQLAVKDLPKAWNAMFKDYLGLKVPNDRVGCLQDVHWSFGLVGYFPTYTLGNLYAAQFWEKINRDIPDLDKRMAKGNFADLLGWLRHKIHRHGRRYRAADLCRKVTGKDLSADPLMRHLEGKLRGVYGL
jgi:carboxypeptidase Taq